MYSSKFRKFPSFTMHTTNLTNLRPSCDNVISCDKSPCHTTSPATNDECLDDFR